MTSDAQGDAIVVADLAQYGAAYSVYSAQTKTWSALKAMTIPIAPVTPFGADAAPTVMSPNLARSPDGQQIVYAYVAVSGGGTPVSQGIYFNTFDILDGAEPQ